MAGAAIRCSSSLLRLSAGIEIGMVSFHDFIIILLTKT